MLSLFIWAAGLSLTDGLGLQRILLIWYVHLMKSTTVSALWRRSAPRKHCLLVQCACYKDLNCTSLSLARWSGCLYVSQSHFVSCCLTFHYLPCCCAANVPKLRLWLMLFLVDFWYKFTRFPCIVWADKESWKPNNYWYSYFWKLQRTNTFIVMDSHKGMPLYKSSDCIAKYSFGFQHSRCYMASLRG